MSSTSTSHSNASEPLEKQKANMNLPLVTALLPSYNSEKFIRKTLDALVAQTWPRVEILIGDDFSKDGTPEIIQEYADVHDNIRILKREKNLGWLGNCNDLMENARGEMMFFAFHDDIVAPDYVSSLVEVLQQDPNAILAYSDIELVDPDGTRDFLQCPEISGVKSATKRGLMMALRRAEFHWWIPNRGIFRKSAYEQIGGIQRNQFGEFSADWTWLLHMSLLGSFVRMPQILCFKHYQKTSLSINWQRTPDKYRGLFRSGIKEVMRSDLSLFGKLLICSCLRGKIIGSTLKSVLRGK